MTCLRLLWKLSAPLWLGWDAHDAASDAGRLLLLLLLRSLLALPLRVCGLAGRAQ